MFPSYYPGALKPDKKYIENESTEMFEFGVQSDVHVTFFFLEIFVWNKNILCEFSEFCCLFVWKSNIVFWKTNIVEKVLSYCEGPLKPIWWSRGLLFSCRRR